MEASFVLERRPKKHSVLPLSRTSRVLNSKNKLTNLDRHKQLQKIKKLCDLSNATKSELNICTISISIVNAM